MASSIFWAGIIPMRRNWRACLPSRLSVLGQWVLPLPILPMIHRNEIPKDVLKWKALTAKFFEKLFKVYGIQRQHLKTNVWCDG